MAKKPLILALILAGAGVTAAVVTSSSSSPSSGSPRGEGNGEPKVAEGKSSPRAAAGREARPVRDLARGRSFAYDVTASRRLGAPDQPAAASLTEIKGSLSFTVVGSSEDGSGATVRVALASPSRKDTPARDGGDGAGALSTPFFLVLRPDGVITTWHFPRKMPGDSRRQLRSIVSAMQIIVDPSPASSSWERTETDEAGQLTAFYEVAGPSFASDGLTKTKLRYDHLRGPQGLIPVSAVGKYDVTGKSRVLVDATCGWPSSIDENTVTTVSLQGGKLAMASMTRARLVSSGEAREHIGSFEAAQASFDPDPDALAEDAALAQRNADEGLVNGATVASLVTDYESAKDHKGRNRSVARLGALLRTHPESIAESRKACSIPRRRRRPRARARPRSARPAAREAQKALVEAVASRQPSSVKQDAVISLVLTESPSPEAKASLKTQSGQPGELGTSATLALGNMAHQLGKEGQSASDIVDDLLARLGAASTSDQKVALLDALGNAGDDRVLPALKASLGDPDASVRAAATSALRFLKTAEADGLLVAAASSPELTTRRAAVFAMAQRDVMAVFAGLEHLVKEDENVELRRSAIRILSRGTESSSEVTELLSWVSQHDADPEVKKAAEAALAPRGAKR
ncbi:MAG: HEAT repeat domain-containing protein [Labilithrix sp.]